WPGGVRTHEYDDERQTEQTRSEGAFPLTKPESPEGDARGEDQAHHDPRHRRTREIPATDCPAEERAHRRRRREHGDAKHAVTAEQPLEVEALSYDASPSTGRGRPPRSRFRSRRVGFHERPRWRSAGGQRRPDRRHLLGERCD